jgi:hypothetical protein
MTHGAVHSQGDGTANTWPPIGSWNWNVGEVRGMVVTGASFRPLHIHINHFQITDMALPSYNNGFFQIGDWHGTLLIRDNKSPIKRI